jgi:hypothetical protein
MTTARATEELWDALCAVREPLMALSVTVWEDRPENGELILADSVGDAVAEASGWLEGAIAAVREPADLGASLVDCGQQFDRLEKAFWSDLASYERLAEVEVLRTERPLWSGWARGVRRYVSDCGELIHHARAALFGCWRELTSELRRSLVTVNATGVGQHIATVKEQA